MESIENQVMTFFADEAVVPVESLTRESKLRSAGEIDSLGLAEFYCECEEHWGIEIPDQKCREFQTIADVVDFIGDRVLERCHNIRITRW